MKPYFTIGICTLDRKDYLREAIKSCLNQDLVSSFEIVIADDGSSYEIADLIEEITSNLNSTNINFTIVKNPNATPMGEASMRNYIVNVANGEFIIWLDDDDLLSNSCLSSYLECINQFPDYQIYYGNLLRTDKNLTPTREYNYREIPEKLMLSSFLLGSVVPNGGSCIKKEVFDIIGNYDPSYIVGTDYNFWVRAALGKCRFKHLEKTIYIYRAHETNAALDKEDDRFFESNARVCELLIANAVPEDLTPFFEWSKDTILAEFQLLMACQILSKKNKDKELYKRAIASLLGNKDYHPYLFSPDMKQMSHYLEKIDSIGFDEAANLLTTVIHFGGYVSQVRAERESQQ